MEVLPSNIKEIPIHYPISLPSQWLTAKINKIANLGLLGNSKFHAALRAMHNETGQDVYKLETILWDIVVVNEPEMAAIILDPENGEKGTDGGFFKPVNIFVEAAHIDGLDESRQPFSILTGEYNEDERDEYIRHKRIVLQALSGSNLNTFSSTFTQQANGLLERLDELNDVEIVAEFDKLTFNIVLEVFLGIKYLNPELQERISSFFRAGSQYKTIKSFTGRAEPLIAAIRDPWYDKENAVYHSVVDPVIDDRMANPRTEGKQDLLDILIGYSLPDGNKLSKEQIESHIKTFIIAGQETTASALSSILYLLLSNPDKMEILVAELAQVLNGEQRDITYEDLKNMPYIKRVIKESLRMYPPTHIIPRIARKDFNLKGYKVNKGELMLVASSAIHYREDLYPEADSFTPERPIYDTDKDPEGYFVWGLHPRACVGRTFAEREIALVLTNILSKKKLTLQTEEVNMISGAAPTRAKELDVSISPANILES